MDRQVCASVDRSFQCAKRGGEGGFFLLLIAIPGLVDESIAIPHGIEPFLDGTLSAGEWDDAFVVSISDNFTLFLKHTQGFLFLGIHATMRGIPSPLIVRDGGVFVLHASSALGTGVYSQQEGSWILRQPFAWQCRASGFSNAAIATRNQFLETEGWVATIGYLGTPTMFEYQIHIKEDPLQMLFLFLETIPPFQVVSWPIPSEFATKYLETITGPIPTEVSFYQEDWAVLEFVFE